MWFDISNGDILTTESASRLISRNERVYHKRKKILALSSEEIEHFSCEELQITLSVKVIDNWSKTDFVLLGQKNVIVNTLKKIRIPFIYEKSAIGLAFFIELRHKETILSYLRSNNFNVTFESKKSVELKTRSGRYETHHYVRPFLKNQDRVFQLIVDNKVFSMLFDGHGKNDVIHYIDKNHSYFNRLFDYPFPNSNEKATEIVNIVIHGFMKKMKDEKIKTQGSGSTFVFAFHDLMNHNVIFGNTGDSRIVWSLDGRRSNHSQDHKPDETNEKKRVEAAGGTVTKEANDVYRVGRSLAISRAIGDTELAPAVIPTAFVYGPFKMKIGGYYIMASDGIFDVMSNIEIFNRLKIAKNIDQELKDLTEISRDRKSHDDMSLLYLRVLND
tara:strand:+ start:16650 stop:17810 length:1161 start_codon:yes stop_codon:yes gene_type:complete